MSEQPSPDGPPTVRPDTQPYDGLRVADATVGVIRLGRVEIPRSEAAYVVTVIGVLALTGMESPWWAYLLVGMAYLTRNVGSRGSDTSNHAGSG